MPLGNGGSWFGSIDKIRWINPTKPVSNMIFNLTFLINPFTHCIFYRCDLIPHPSNQCRDMVESRVSVSLDHPIYLRLQSPKFLLLVKNWIKLPQQFIFHIQKEAWGFESNFSLNAINHCHKILLLSKDVPKMNFVPYQYIFSEPFYGLHKSVTMSPCLRNSIGECGIQ